MCREAEVNNNLQQLGTLRATIVAIFEQYRNFRGHSGKEIWLHTTGILYEVSIRKLRQNQENLSM